MAKKFNINGVCSPDGHYMVALGSRLAEIKKMIDAGDYFTINRARQYGKTTILKALVEFLREDYIVVSLDFQNIESAEFSSGNFFVHALAREISRKIKRRKDVPEGINKKMMELSESRSENLRLAEMFDCFSEWCGQSEKPIVLLIDEIDTATNNQVFLDFLAQLRAAYLDRREMPTFQSVILAGVCDVRHIKQKIRPDEEHKVNSPWNIAAKFRVGMSFTVEDITEMLEEYEKDYQTGMDIEKMSEWIYDYTSGYPYLVSSLCKNLDEEIIGTEGYPDLNSVWTKKGFLEAIKLLVNDNNALFQSLTGKLTDYPMLRTVLYELLFTGKQIPYVPQNRYIEVAEMFGFIKNDGGTAVIANRIFETVLYNLFISEEFTASEMYDAGAKERNQFIVNGHLNVRRVLEKFVETFDDLYGDRDETFLEDAGRRYFMLFLKPIINGVGNSYVEPETRNRERMDLVIDYCGERSVIEMKVWRGNAYHERGEEQLSAYLDHFHLKKGYMLSFNFNRKKEIGVKEIVIGDKLLIEATV